MFLRHNNRTSEWQENTPHWKLGNLSASPLQMVISSFLDAVSPCKSSAMKLTCAHIYGLGRTEWGTGRRRWGLRSLRSGARAPSMQSRATTDQRECEEESLMSCHTTRFLSTACNRLQIHGCFSRPSRTQLFLVSPFGPWASVASAHADSRRALHGQVMARGE